MGLFKRGQVWWMCFTHNGEPIKRSTETRDKKLAEKVYFKVMTEVNEGKWFNRLPGESKTFSELAEKYEESVFKESGSWQTVQCYLKQLKEFFGPYTLSEINPAIIDDFKQKRKGDKVKPATINRQLNILKRMLNLAKKRWMWIKDVPPIEMEPRADVKRVRHLSFSEFQRLLSCCDDWLRPIVEMAAWTGLRQGNVLHLKKSEVNLETRLIMIKGEEVKNHENLIIPIARPAREVLQKVMREDDKSPYVFCDEDGRPYYKMIVQRYFKKALKQAGIGISGFMT